MLSPTVVEVTADPEVMLEVGVPSVSELEPQVYSLTDM